MIQWSDRGPRPMSGVLRTYSRILDMNHDRREKLFFFVPHLFFLPQYFFKVERNYVQNGYFSWSCRIPARVNSKWTRRRPFQGKFVKFNEKIFFSRTTYKITRVGLFRLSAKITKVFSRACC